MNNDEWDWDEISLNIDIKDVINNPNERWSRYGLSENKGICIKVTKMNLPNAKQLWYWNEISQNIPIEDVINNPNERWYKYRLSCNKNICMKVIRMDLPNAIGDWNWNHISENIDIEEVIRYPNETWDREGLSNNKNIHARITALNLPNATRKWCWSSISIDRYENRLLVRPKYTERIKDNDRRHISNYSDISIFWIRFKDKVGLNKSKWESDMDIICLH
jgi:hypothetical protein